MRMLPESPLLLNSRLAFEMFDDFDWYISPHRWTNLTTGTASAFAQSDAEHGIISGATGAVDNQDVACRSTNEFALYQDNYAFIFESLIQYTEINTDDANIATGIANAAGVDLLANNGAGVTAFNSGALIYKVDGGTVWRCNANSGTGTVQDTVSVQTAGGAAFQRLTIKGRTVMATVMEITYFLNGQPLTDSNNRAIAHSVTLGTPTEMRIVPGYAKAGGANTETLLIDSCYFGAMRV